MAQAADQQPAGVLRLVVADDHQLFRETLVNGLRDAGGFDIIGQAADGEDAVALCTELAPDVILMDIGMPRLNGVAAATRIKAACPATRVLILSMHSEKRFVEAALAAGVSGYLLKDISMGDLITALEIVAAGAICLSEEVAGRAVITEPDGARSAPRTPLTAREREVLQLIAEGMSLKMTAAHLGLSVKTIETHRRQIMEKADTYTVAGLVRYALREGVTTLDRE